MRDAIEYHHSYSPRLGSRLISQRIILHDARRSGMMLSNFYLSILISLTIQIYVYTNKYQYSQKYTSWLVLTQGLWDLNFIFFVLFFYCLTISFFLHLQLHILYYNFFYIYTFHYILFRIRYLQSKVVYTRIPPQVAYETDSLVLNLRPIFHSNKK